MNQQGTAITAFTPRTTTGSPINVANASPTIDVNASPTALALSAEALTAATNPFKLLTADGYAMPAASNLKTVFQFKIENLAEGKTAKVTFVRNTDEMATYSYTANGFHTLEIDENINFDDELQLVFKYENGGFDVKYNKALLIAVTA